MSWIQKVEISLKTKKINNSTTPCFTIGLISFMIHLNDLVELKVLYLCIVESVVQLYFDILHGIKQKDVPLTTVVEFAVFLGYDGQLQQNFGVSGYNQ